MRSRSSQARLAALERHAVRVDDQVSGEGMCVHIAAELGMPVDAYLAQVEALRAGAAAAGANGSLDDLLTYCAEQESLNRQELLFEARLIANRKGNQGITL